VKTGTQFYISLVPCIRRDKAWIPAFAGMTLCLVNYGLLSTTTLNSFKINHKAYISGLELGLETPFNFDEIQNHPKILGFYF